MESLEKFKWNIKKKTSCISRGIADGIPWEIFGAFLGDFFDKIQRTISDKFPGGTPVRIQSGILSEIPEEIPGEMLGGTLVEFQKEFLVKLWWNRKKQLWMVDVPVKSHN